jgi:hypothetical protein
VVRIGESGGAYRNEGKRLLSKPNSRFEDNIKMGFKK